MKKAFWAALLCLMFLAAAASADAADNIKPIWLQALENAQAGDEVVVYPEPAVVSGTLLTFQSHHLHTTSCIKNRTATLNNIGYILRCHIKDLFIQKAIIPFVDTLNLYTFC